LKAITIHELGRPWPVPDNSPSRAVEQGLQDTGLPIVFSHCGLGKEAHWTAARKHDWNISITPESEYHYGHGNQTTRFILDQASLGIDTNWTFSGDILNQARLWLQSTRNTSYNQTINMGKIPRQTPMTVEDAFLLATRQGGRAVRRDDLGVLKVGAQADIIVWDGDSPNMLGWTDPIAAVILHANVGDIQHVMIGGEFRKRDGKLVLKKGEWADISARFVKAARRIQQENQKPEPLPDKMFGVGEFADVEICTTKRA
jgi:cytosine/adenosine deaminase-related metal-dependent hydrolase